MRKLGYGMLGVVLIGMVAAAAVGQGQTINRVKYSEFAVPPDVYTDFVFAGDPGAGFEATILYDEQRFVVAVPVGTTLRVPGWHVRSGAIIRLRGDRVHVWGLTTEGPVSFERRTVER